MMPEMQFLNELPTQYIVFLGAVSMVTGYALDWTLHRWGFGIFLNTAVLAVGAFLAFAAAEQAGYNYWEDGLKVIMTGIGGGVTIFIVLAMLKNKLLP